MSDTLKAAAPSAHASSFDDAVDFASRQFVQGFLVGQASVWILVVVVVRWFLLKNGTDTRVELARRTSGRASAWSGSINRSKMTGNVSGSSTDGANKSEIGAENGIQMQILVEQHILAKTLYGFEPEPASWLTVLVAQTIARYRSSPVLNAALVNFVDARLNYNLPSVLAPIVVSHLSLGDAYPVVKSVQIKPGTSLRAEIAFEFNDNISIGIETHVLLNWPRSCLASLPVSLVVSLVKFEGSLAITFPPSLVPPGSPFMTPSNIIPQMPTPSTTSIPSISFSLLPPVTMDFDVRSLLGNRTKIKDLPKLSSLIVNKLKTILIDELVWPKKAQVLLPTFTPSSFTDTTSGTSSPPSRHQRDFDSTNKDSAHMPCTTPTSTTPVPQLHPTRPQSSPTTTTTTTPVPQSHNAWPHSPASSGSGYATSNLGIRVGMTTTPGLYVPSSSHPTSNPQLRNRAPFNASSNDPTQESNPDRNTPDDQDPHVEVMDLGFIKALGLDTFDPIKNT